MAVAQRSDLIRSWPSESQEAAQLVIDAHGEPDEVSDSQLVWYDIGPWKRIVATKAYWSHDFPAPHIDCVESVIDYRVPVHKFTPLAEFDGSLICERTAGEVSARCHDEQANFLALNLMHDIVTDSKDVQGARDYYVKEFLDVRRRKPTPYMNKLQFQPPDGQTADPDERAIADEELDRAKAEAGGGA